MPQEIENGDRLTAATDMRFAAKRSDSAVPHENQIVVYQPNETIRLDVRLENETVWLTQAKIGVLFGVDRSVINRHIHNIYNTDELSEDATCAKIAQVQIEGGRSITRRIPFYNLDMIIAVGYRVNSKSATHFRQWATKVLREHLLRGFTVNTRINALEDKVDRRVSKVESDIAELKNQVDFFVKTATPPTQGIFYDGQLWDARSFVEKLIAKAKSAILLIDNWVDIGTLDMLAKKRGGVKVELVTSKRGNRLAPTDIAKFEKQYGTLDVKISDVFHDRFLILDDKELYLIGASLKDLGAKCFGFTKMDAGEIAGIKARV